jgi:hypothetical protein
MEYCGCGGCGFAAIRLVQSGPSRPERHRRTPINCLFTTTWHSAGMTNPTADQLRQVLVSVLAGATGLPEARWDVCLGELVRNDLPGSRQANWRLPRRRTQGADGRIIRTAVALVQADHPYVAW